MRIVLGLDVGTTSLSAVAFDCDSRRAVGQLTLPNEGARIAALPGDMLAAELDLACVGSQVTELLDGIVHSLPAGASVLAIGVTGQQHGMALLDDRNQPVGSAITWQDQRTLGRIPGESRTWLQAFVEDAGGPGAFTAMGCQPAAGFLGPSLYWWMNQPSSHPDGLHLCLIPDAIVSILTGTSPVTDVTDGGSSGLMNIVKGDWAWEVIDSLRLPRDLFPPVVPAGRPHALLRESIAAAAGLPSIPVCVAAGDNQASFAGSVRDPLATVLVNVGTGGQISTLVPSFTRLEGIETRAFFGSQYLLVGAGLYGGRAYAYLQSLFQEVGAALFDQEASIELYEKMNGLAAQVPSGSDGLRCAPLFTGTRDEPDRRASFTGIGPTNLTPGHLARALLEGIAEGFWEQYSTMLSAAGAREMLVGAGNGLTQNRVLADVIARRFALALHLTGGVEAAALGAALLAADGIGALSLAEGMASITYDRVEAPPRA
ncbi:MAG: sedoheptulokinase [Anaerolineae bacterium]